MYNLGDDSELDRLSREAAGRYETPGNANWRALSEELDKIMPEEKKKRRFLFWWILPGLLAGGAITYGIIHRDSNPTTAIEKNIPAVSTDRSNEPSTAQANHEKVNEPGISQTDKATITPAEKTVTVTTPQVKESSTALLSEGKTGVNILSSKKGKNTTGLNNTKSVARSTDKVEAGSVPVQSAVINPETSKPVEQPIVIKEQKEVTKENNETEKKEQANLTTPAKTEKEPATEESVIKEDKKPVQKNSLPARGKGWSFGLLAGVDKSTVKFKYGYKPGINLGLEIAYHFNDTWAVKTGGIYTQKNYKLAGEDFTAPKGSWASYYKLDQVEGFCRMWEVPLLVSYTLHNNPNSKKSVTLNTGLSSYFMTKEDYDYYYYYNSAPASRNFSYNSTDTHVLSIVHLSAGFENRLSNTMSLLVEPYAKIPLGGVGFGSIRLSSFGLNFSVQYRQPHKK